MSSSKCGLYCLVSWIVLTVGCGGGDQWKEAAENVKRVKDFENKKLKTIADDKALNDQQAYPKYLDSLPEVRKDLPKSVKPWWAVNPFDGGWHIIFRDVILTQWEGSTPEQRAQSERDFIRNRLLMCKRVLEDMKHRRARQATITMFVQQGAADNYVEIFRALVTQDDLAKFVNLPAKAEAGDVFDARGPKIGTLAKIELNRFPELDYVKRSK